MPKRIELGEYAHDPLQLQHRFWFVPRTHFMPHAKQKAVRRKDDGGMIGKTGGTIDGNEPLCIEEGSPLPRFQELHRKKALQAIDLDLPEILSGTHRTSLLVVSHRWQDADHPNRSGSVLRHIRQFLGFNPKIQAVWLDWMCVPQDGGSLRLTDGQRRYFSETLSQCGMLYLGLTVLAIWDQPCSQRFWPRFECWLAMQTVCRDGLVVAPDDKSRLHLKEADFRNKRREVVTNETMHASLGSLPHSELSQKLMDLGTELMYEQDRAIALKWLETLMSRWKELYSQFVCPFTLLSDGSREMLEESSGSAPSRVLQEGDRDDTTNHAGESIADSTDSSGSLEDGYEFGPSAREHALVHEFISEMSMVSTCRCSNQASEYQNHHRSLGCFNLSTPMCEHCSGMCDCAWKEPLLYLIKRKADVSGRTRNGSTPLLQAAMQGSLRIVRMLLGLRAELARSANNQGWTPLHEAASDGRIDLSRVLLDAAAGANGAARAPDFVNSACNDSTTPLFQAAARGHVEVICNLLDHKANINVRQRDGTTVLMRAVASRNVEACKLIINSGCYVCGGYKRNRFKPCSQQCSIDYHLALANSDQESALSLARAGTRERGLVNILNLLVQHGVK